jgi:hypothetical protein
MNLLPPRTSPDNPVGRPIPFLLWDDLRRSGAEFLIIDLELALTFLGVAHTTRNKETKRRNQKNAGRAHDAVVVLIPKLRLIEAERRTIGESLRLLNSDFRQWERVAKTWPVSLLKTLIDPGTPASVKVRAAEAIFNHAAKAIEIEDIEARVAELEGAAESSKGRR